VTGTALQSSWIGMQRPRKNPMLHASRHRRSHLETQLGKRLGTCLLNRGARADSDGRPAGGEQLRREGDDHGSDEGRDEVDPEQHQSWVVDANRAEDEVTKPAAEDACQDRPEPASRQRPARDQHVGCPSDQTRYDKRRKQRHEADRYRHSGPKEQHQKDQHKQATHA
jgi:hypothetical protein